jgi:hypothetical protein
MTPDTAALFGLTPPTDDDRRMEKRYSHEAKLVGRMRDIYGAQPTHHCGECAWLVPQGGCAGRYLKCRQAKVTRGAGTDWRAGWIACGKYKPREPK